MKKAIGIMLPAVLAVVSAAHAQSLDQAMRYLEIEQYGKAQQAFQQLAQSKNTDDNVYYLGYYYLKTNQADQAKAQFDQVLARNPKHALSHTGMVGYNLLVGNTSAVNGHADQARNLSKKNPDVLYRLGEAYTISAKNNSPADALNALDAAIAADGKKAEYYIARGVAYRLKGEGGKAMGDFTQATNLKPNWGMSYLYRGRLMEGARAYTEAAKIYNEGIAKDPQFSTLHKELAEVYFLAKRYDQAQDSYRKYIELSDRSNETMLQYAGFLIKAGKHQEALAVLGQLPDDASQKKSRALAYSQANTKQFAEGLTNIEKYWQVTPDDKRNAEDFDIYSQLLLGSGKDTVRGVQYAVEAARRRVELGADRDSVQYTETVRNMANLLKTSKRHDSAAVYYARVANTSKATGSDWVAVGQAYHNAKKYDQADTAFGTAIQRYPDYPYAIYWKAFNKQKMTEAKQKDAAYAWYKRFVDANPDLTQYKPFVLNALKALGNYHALQFNKTKSESARKTAEDYLKRVLAIDPNDKYATEGLKSLGSKG